MTVQLIHPPRTGGTLAASLLPVHRNGHTFRLAHVRDGDRAVVFLRDPLARFVSAFDYTKRHSERVGGGYFDAITRFPSASAFALTGDLDHELFRPLTWWVPSLEGVWFAGRTERLRYDLPALAQRLGVRIEVPPHRAPVRSALSQKARHYLRRHYAADYALLETHDHPHREGRGARAS